MRKLLLAAAALAFIAPAHAYTPVICEFGPYGPLCEQMAVNPNAKIIHTDPALDENADGVNETRAQWRSRCKPTLSARDPQTGMRRWTWAQGGCQYGPE